jgi:hypothetical protein
MPISKNDYLFIEKNPGIIQIFDSASNKENKFLNEIETLFSSDIKASICGSWLHSKPASKCYHNENVNMKYYKIKDFRSYQIKFANLSSSKINDFSLLFIDERYAIHFIIFLFICK